MASEKPKEEPCSELFGVIGESLEINSESILDLWDSIMKLQARLIETNQQVLRIAEQVAELVEFVEIKKGGAW